MPKKNKTNKIALWIFIAVAVLIVLSAIGIGIYSFISGNGEDSSPGITDFEKGTTHIIITGIEFEGSGFDSKLQLCLSTSKIFASSLFPPISCEFKDSKGGGIDCICQI